MTSPAIRELAASDERAWRALWRAYLAFYETERPDAVYAETFRRLLDPAEPMRGLVAERDGAVSGICNLILHRHCWRTENVVYLQDLFVAPEARGTGAGRALIEASYALADAEGAPYVYWMTQEFNYAGRMLYDRVGARTPFIKYQRP